MPSLPASAQSLFTLWQNKNTSLYNTLTSPKRGSKSSISHPTSKKTTNTEKTWNAFSDRVLLTVAQENFDEHVDAIRHAYPHCAPTLIQDALQVVCNHSKLPYTLIGIPVTGTIRDLLALSHKGQEWAELLTPDALCLSVMPYHLAAATSVQAMANIVASLANIHPAPEDEKKALLQTLREQLVPYSVLPHVNLDQEASQMVGTAVVMIAVPTGTPLPPHLSAIPLQEEGINVLAGKPASWGDGVVEALIQHTTYEWGASAREQGRTESVLCVNNVDIKVGTGCLEFHASVDTNPYGVATVNPACVLWALPLAYSVWEERGVAINDD